MKLWAVHYEVAYEGASLCGVFDTFEAARSHADRMNKAIQFPGEKSYEIIVLDLNEISEPWEETYVYWSEASA